MQLQRAPAAGCSSRQRTCRKPRTVPAAAAVAAPAVSVPPALEAAQRVVEQNGGWFSPEVTDRPEVLIQQNVPFLTTQAGALPEKPRNLFHALGMYGK